MQCLSICAQAQRDEIKEMVAEVKFVSLICDGSADNSHTEAELAYVQYCHQGSTNVHFVGVKNIAKGYAQVIEVAMSTLFTDYFACRKMRLWELELTAQALSDVSAAFQQKEITIADINSEITACKEVIEKYRKKDGPSLKMINGKDQFLGEAFEEARRGMAHGLLKSISDRFEEGVEGIIVASSTANLKLWPTSHLDRSSRPLHLMFPKWNQSGPSSRVFSTQVIPL